VSARDELRALRAGATSSGTDPYGVMFDDKGKMLLPGIPEHEDTPGLCKWLTAVLNLDRSHPITRGIHEGLRGPDGHVILERAGAVSIRFEPASKINNPTRLIEALSWWKQPTDGLVHSFKADHCRQISHVVRMLCGAHRGMTEAQQTEAIIGTFMHAAITLEGATTYGTTGQRYEAAMALRREVDQVTGRAIGPDRYFIDANTGEYVIAVSDLAEAARRHVGSSLPRGWLDARIEDLGWARITLQGYGQPGRDGRKGPHARINAYRGHLSAITDDPDEQPDTTNPVNT
jgi:hypothetical protein